MKILCKLGLHKWGVVTVQEEGDIKPWGQCLECGKPDDILNAAIEETAARRAKD